MITRQIGFPVLRYVLLILGVIITMRSSAQSQEIKIQIDAAKKYQTMDGFGVNVNTAWWSNGMYRDTKVLQPAIDLLVDSLGATIYRAVIEEIDWEAVNDDNDPDHFNWNYYNSVFSNARFQGVFNTLRYLNQKGITDNLMISFMGAPPAALPITDPDPRKSWMGGIDNTISPGMEDELAESIAALLYYMRYTAKVQFTLVSPMNETDIQSRTKSAGHPGGVVEGPNIPDAVQYVCIIKKLAQRLDAIGMSDIRFVAPDAGFGDKLFGEYLNEVLKDPYLLGKMAHWGVHEYGKDSDHYRKQISRPDNPNKSFWVTETAGIKNLFGQLDDDARAFMFWDGYDCVYQHGRRNGYGDIPPNDWVFWEKDDGKPLIGFNAESQKWIPRKQFYEQAHLMKFIKPGSQRIGTITGDNSLIAYTFCNPDGNIVITGRNDNNRTIAVSGILSNLPPVKNMKLIFTNSTGNFIEGNEIIVSGEKFKASIPAESVFTITGNAELKPSSMNAIKPEPSDWYAGDIHVHRNCGEGTSILPESEFTAMMEPNNLAVISVLADMGNGEVKDSKSDLPKVTGKDAPQSLPGRMVHWDAEWHFDPAGVTFENKAIGGHLILLGLKKAHTLWNESPYKIIEWGKSQDAITGFCHMQYLNDSLPNELNCCTPIDYPVEAALGTIDFLSEDVWLNDAAINGYYRLLNCGFRLGWSAGTDFPCNNSRPFGSLLTYVQVKDQPMNYRNWIEGIKNGRTVVTTNGHVEFLDLKINGIASPGDEIKLKGKGKINIEVTWTAVKELQGRIEIICNGKVIASREGSASPGKALLLESSPEIEQSSWICARRMDDRGHQSHTAPVYIPVKNKPVRASAEDAKYFVRWIDNMIDKTNTGGKWNKYFTKDQDIVQNRYRKAKNIYLKIAEEAGALTDN
jgi:O-glycosyl hydrolase